MTKWQACPRCGLDRIANARAIRSHDEFCNGAFQPFMTMLADRGLRPFERVPWINPETDEPDPRVLGELLPLRWRVAPDQWYRLEAEVRRQFPALTGTEHLPARLFGWPIDVDPALKAGAIVLESDTVAPMVATERSPRGA